MACVPARAPSRPFFTEALESRMLLSATVPAFGTPTGGVVLGQLFSTGKLVTLSQSTTEGDAFTIKFKLGTLTVSELKNQLYLNAVGTGTKSLLMVDGAVELGGVSVSGPLKEFSALSVDLIGNMAFGDSVQDLSLESLADGTVFVAGDMNVVDVGNISIGTLAAAGTINRLTLGTLNNATILSGANLGPDAVLGGGNDVFSAGGINLLNVEGAMMTSDIAVGVSPGVDGIFGDSDDTLSGGGRIGKTILALGADSTSRIEASSFGSAKIAPFDSLIPARRFAPPTADPNFLVP